MEIFHNRELGGVGSHFIASVTEVPALVSKNSGEFDDRLVIPLRRILIHGAARSHVDDWHGPSVAIESDPRLRRLTSVPRPVANELDPREIVSRPSKEPDCLAEWRRQLSARPDRRSACDDRYDQQTGRTGSSSSA